MLQLKTAKYSLIYRTLRINNQLKKSIKQELKNLKQKDEYEKDDLLDDTVKYVHCSTTDQKLLSGK